MLLAYSFHGGVIQYWAVVAIQALLRSRQRVAAREREALELQVGRTELARQLTASQLSALKMQLQPHFRFNTLGAIMVLVQQGRQREAEGMLARLSDLLRLVVDDVHMQEVPLWRELEFLRLYLSIEAVRFEDRLRVRIATEPQLADAMVLQPIVENAVRHGLGQSEEAVSIDIAARQSDRQLVLTVSIWEARNGREAVAAIRDQQPDLVLFDVQMQRLDGFAVVEAIGADKMPSVIFVTAHDHYAVRAFEISAVDYLLKPVTAERFQTAVARAASRLQVPAADDSARQMLTMLDAIAHPARRLSRAAIRSADRTIFVPVEAVDWIEAAQNYVCLHVGQTRHLVHVSMNSIEAALDPDGFLRVHRSHIVNLRRIRQVWSLARGHYVIELSSGERVPAGRTYGDRVRDGQPVLTRGRRAALLGRVRPSGGGTFTLSVHAGVVPPGKQRRLGCVGLSADMISATLGIVSLCLAAVVPQPGPTRPEVLAPGVLSAGEVYRGAFTPDGGTLYFFKKTGSGETFRIFSSSRTTSGWATPAVVDLGGEFSDLYPAISGDGRRLVFSSYRPVPGRGSEKPNAHLWSAERTADGWSAPVFLARASTPGHYHSWVEFGFDGALYFRRTTPDWTRNVTMRAAPDGDGFGEPEPYADVERWKGWRTDVRVAGGAPGPDGRLVFLDVAATNPATGRGASDIWVSLRRGPGWTDPQPLGAGVNSDGYDVFPFVSPDGRDLYFVRDFATFHRVALAEALASIDAGTAVHYVANSGMLVAVSGRRFLIDAPIRDGNQPYATSSAAERTLLEGARGRYADVDAILITHWHEDHFSAEAVAAHLTGSARTTLVSSPEVVDRVRAVAPTLAASRLRAILPMPGQSQAVDVGGVAVHVLRVRHNPARRLPEQHVAFLIAGGAPVLHVGDADPKADNFAVLKALPAVDLAFLPFWYVSDVDNRRMVAEAIRPRRIVAMHVPPADARSVDEALRAGHVVATLASSPGSALDIGR